MENFQRPSSVNRESRFAERKVPKASPSREGRAVTRQSTSANRRSRAQSLGRWSIYNDELAEFSYDEESLTVIKPRSEKNKKKKFLKQLQPMLMKWFKDTRPVLEHAMYIRLEDISLSVSHNINMKKKQKRSSSQGGKKRSQSSRQSFFFDGRMSMWDSRMSTFYDERTQEPVVETKKRISFFNKAIDRYYQDQTKLQKSEPDIPEAKTAGELDTELYQLDRLIKTPNMEEHVSGRKTSAKTTKVRFKESSSVSLYQTLLGTKGSAMDTSGGNKSLWKRASKKQDSSNSKENVRASVSNSKNTTNKAKSKKAIDKEESSVVLNAKSNTNTATSVLKLKNNNNVSLIPIIQNDLPTDKPFPTISKSKYPATDVNQNADTESDEIPQQNENDVQEDEIDTPVDNNDDDVANEFLSSQTGDYNIKSLKARIREEIENVNLEIEALREENNHLQSQIMSTRLQIQHRKRNNLHNPGGPQSNSSRTNSNRSVETTDELSAYSIFIYALSCACGILITKFNDHYDKILKQH